MMYLIFTVSMLFAGQQTIVGEKRIAITGAVFTVETIAKKSQAAMGKIGVREPNHADGSKGLLWGNLYQQKRSGTGAYTLYYADAMNFCDKRNTRLPTKEEYEHLVKLLGDGVPGYYYSPYQLPLKNKKEVIPSFAKLQMVWTKTTIKSDSDYYIYAFATGESGYYQINGFYLKDNYNPQDIRCVQD